MALPSDVQANVFPPTVLQGGLVGRGKGARASHLFLRVFFSVLQCYKNILIDGIFSAVKG